MACSTKKNTVVSRAYHNLTTRYNGLYYSTVNIEEGVYKIEKANKENYERTLPVYIYPTPEAAKSTFAEFDKAIKKSSLSIQKHTIKDSKGNENPNAGNWIDNNWINIGISHFYKREFFSAIESFEYVARTYRKSSDKFVAMLWLIKANNEIGAVSTSETYLSLLKNERGLPRAVKNELPVVYADYYVRRGQYTEAIAKLLDATRNNKPIIGLKKKNRARYSFIIAQLSEKQGDKKRALQYYYRTIKLKPAYEMIFYSKIKMARLIDVKKNSSQKIKKDLLKMAKEFKNSDYYDVIYYTLGDISEKEKNITAALDYYNLSVRKSTTNASQKALSFLRMAEINFDLTNYQPASAYYDSTIAALPKDHPDYENIIARKKTLETLVKQIKTISREDSLQRIAKMSESDRNRFIDDMIDKMEKEEERKMRELENAQNSGASTTNTLLSSSSIPSMGNTASFYFYNPTLVSFGVVDFTKKWGNRKQEDNWRRSNKALVMDEVTPEALKKDSLRVAKQDSVKKMKRSRNFYLTDLPMNDSLLRKSNGRKVKAYYVMGSVYKEDLNNIPKTISTFEELNTRFPDNKYALQTYYGLYRIYLQQKNTSKADYYKNKILTDFPDSEFAMLIQNPEYAQEMNAKKGEVEIYYGEVLDLYKANNYKDSYSRSKSGIEKYGKSEYLPKFEFIKSVSAGKLQGPDTLEKYLKLLVAKYPNADVTPLSKDILASIHKQKNPEILKAVEKIKIKKDTFSLNMQQAHFVAAVLADNTKIVADFKTGVVNFNTVFYNGKVFEISGTLFDKQQIVVIKSFADGNEARLYYENMEVDTDIFKGDVKRSEIEIFPISSDNLPILYKTKNVAEYKKFFEENYKAQNNKN